MRTIGDVISTDTFNAVNYAFEAFKSKKQTDNGNQIHAVDVRKNVTLDNEELKRLTEFSFLPESVKVNDLGIEKKYRHKDIYSFGNIEARDNQTYKSNYEVDDQGNLISPRKNNESLVLESELKKKGFLGNALDNLAHGVKQGLDDMLYDQFGFTLNLNRALLGNLYTVSLTKVGSQIEEAMKGNLIKAGQSIKEYADLVKDSLNGEENTTPSGNLGYGYDKYTNQPATGEIFDSTPMSFKGIGQSLGNLANRLAPSSIANN
jgi:hypothetical protein